MAVRKQCRAKGCARSPRCDHPWWFDVQHRGRRYRMSVDDFALTRGAKLPVASKQEAEKVWQPKFIAEIVSGKDPRVRIEPKPEQPPPKPPMTIAELLQLYRERYVNVEPLKARAVFASQ